jgi:hypothetical protein
MKVSSFNAAQHYKEVTDWWKRQDYPVLPLEALPKIGYIVDIEGLNLCAGWLYKTDANFALAEGFVGNPNVPWQLRTEGLDMLSEAIIKTAKEEGFKAVLSWITNKRMIERAELHGFKTIVKDVNMMSRIL